MTKQRESNFELLRIVLMIAVPLYHMMIYAGIIYMPYGTLTTEALFICSGSAIVADYAFMAMSSFFLLGKKEKVEISRIFKLGIQVMVLFVFKYIMIRKVLGFPENDYYVNDFFLKGAWWFIYVYLMILLIYPILNKIIYHLKQSHLLVVCVILGAYFVWNGIRNDVHLFHDFIAFLFVYFVVGYLKRTDFKTYFGLKNTKAAMFAIYIIGFLVTFLFLWWVKYPGHLPSDEIASDIVRVLVGKYSFIQFVMGIAVFLLFKSISIKTNKYINALAKNVFWVFLLHETVMAIYWYFGKMRTINDRLPYQNILEVILWAVIYIVSCFVFAWFIRSCYEVVSRKVVSMLHKLKELCKEKKIVSFILVWLVFWLALFLRGYGGKVNSINATMLAFSYEYGFISRGLIGSIYQGLDVILPGSMLSYTSVLWFTQIITLIYYLIMLTFFVSCLMKCSKTVTETMKYAIIFFSIWAVPMFASQYNFGRLDVYCVMLSLLGAILLIIEKAEWMVVLFSAFGVMVHQGNVFMYLNIILVLLIYKALCSEGKKRNKYLFLFALSFGVASVLFLYFEFFSHFDGENILEDIIATATALCNKGDYHEDVIDHEILGIDLSSREIRFRKQNLVQFPIFIAMMSPYIVLTVKFFRNIITRAESKIDKWKYLLLSIGSATIFPDLLLKCDYGRWMFAIICYYCVVILTLLAMKDKIVEKEFLSLTTSLNKKSPFSIVLLAYPIIFQPLYDVAICYVVANWAGKINDIFLHWW